MYKRQARTGAAAIRNAKADTDENPGIRSVLDQRDRGCPGRVTRRPARSSVAAGACLDLLPALERLEQLVLDLAVARVDAARIGRIGLVEVGGVQLGRDGRLLVLERGDELGQFFQLALLLVACLLYTSPSPRD